MLKNLINFKFSFICSEKYEVVLNSYIDGGCLTFLDGHMASKEECERLIDAVKVYIDHIDNNKIDVDLMIDKSFRAQDRVNGSFDDNRSRNCGYIYLGIDINDGLFKIGKTINPKQRLRQLRRKFPEISFINVIKTTDMMWSENYLHQLYSDYRIYDEWFNLPAKDVLWLRNVRFVEPGIIEFVSCGLKRDWNDEILEIHR